MSSPKDIQTLQEVRIKAIKKANPITVHPVCAAAFGDINKALIVQQITYLQSLPAGEERNTGSPYALGQIIDGRNYIWNSVSGWIAQYFMWMSPKTFERKIKELKDEDLLLVTNEPSVEKFKRDIAIRRINGQDVSDAWLRANGYRAQINYYHVVEDKVDALIEDYKVKIIKEIEAEAKEKQKKRNELERKHALKSEERAQVSKSADIDHRQNDAGAEVEEKTSANHEIQDPRQNDAGLNSADLSPVTLDLRQNDEGLYETTDILTDNQIHIDNSTDTNTQTFAPSIDSAEIAPEIDFDSVLIPTFYEAYGHAYLTTKSRNEFFARLKQLFADPGMTAYELPLDFDLFYAAYPKKKDRMRAEIEWEKVKKKMKKSGVRMFDLLNALMCQAAHRSLFKQRGPEYFYAEFKDPKRWIKDGSFTNVEDGDDPIHDAVKQELRNFSPADQRQHWDMPGNTIADVIGLQSDNQVNAFTAIAMAYINGGISVSQNLIKPDNYLSQAMSFARRPDLAF